MDLRDIEAVVAVNRYGSYFEAAYQISISLSTLSRRINHLEEELNIRIFNRAVKSKQVSLTPEGAKLIGLFEDMIKLESTIIDQCHLINSNAQEDITIGYMPTFVSDKRRFILSGFTTSFPQYNIHKVSDHCNGLLSRLNSGSIDCCLLPLEDSELSFYDTLLPKSKYTWVPAYGFPTLRIAVPAGSSIAQTKAFLPGKCGMLEKQTFIFNATEQDKHPYFLEKFLGLKNMKKRYIDFSEPDVIKNIIRTGGGVMPAYVSYTEADGIKYIPVEGFPDAMTVYLIYDNDKLSRPLKSFSEYIQKLNLITSK